MSHLFEALRRAVAVRGTRVGVNPLGAAGAWVFRADAPGALVGHRVYTLTIGVVVQGNKRVQIGDTELLYGERHGLVVTGEGAYASQVLEARRDRPYLSLGMAVPPELVVRTLMELSDVASGPSSQEDVSATAFVARLDDAVLEPLLRWLQCLDDPAERKVLAPLALQELVFRLLRSDAALALRQAVYRAGDEAKMVDIMAFIRENVDRKLSVEQLAKRAAMSPSHFAHRFRDVVRMSPMRYLKHVRLDHARGLLVQPGARASEVAQRSGYASASHFCRDFKQHFGVSPRGYVERMRQTAGMSKLSAETEMASASQRS